LDANPSHAIRLAYAPFASAARINTYRSYPNGITEVTEDLRKRMGKESDLDEVETKMRPDNGYGGKNSRIKQEVKHGNLKWG
jgi:hypothetical protein